MTTSEGIAGPVYRIALPEFEGPLDLLLHLCKTHEIDIVSIPIALVTEKYLEYLELMRTLSVDVAAEYLAMAATLAYLKSRELVPTPEPIEGGGDDGEQGVDPRQELIRRLLEYQKYKAAAEQLVGRPIEGRNVFPRGATLDGKTEAGWAEHSVWKLIEAWARVLEKAAPEHVHDVLIERISVAERLHQIIDRIEQGGGSFRFDSLIDPALGGTELRHQIVVTLLAVLELARLRVIRVLQQGEAGPFFITSVEGAELQQARRATITSDVVPEAAASAEPTQDEEPHAESRDA